MYRFGEVSRRTLVNNFALCRFGKDEIDHQVSEYWPSFIGIMVISNPSKMQQMPTNQKRDGLRLVSFSFCSHWLIFLKSGLLWAGSNKAWIDLLSAGIKELSFSDHTHDDYAASSHKHSASDITSGTLPASRGGTGYTSLSSLKSALGISSSSLQYALKSVSIPATADTAYYNSTPNTATTSLGLSFTPYVFFLGTGNYSGVWTYNGNNIFLGQRDKGASYTATVSSSSLTLSSQSTYYISISACTGYAVFIGW